MLMFVLNDKLIKMVIATNLEKKTMENQNFNPYQAPTSSLEMDNESDEWELLDEPNSLSIGSGMAWISEAWQVFKARPLLWIGLTLLYFAVIFGLSALTIIPIVGFAFNVVVGFVSLMLMAGMSYVAYQIEVGEHPSVGDVFVAFQEKLTDFLWLWLWQFLISLGLMLVVGVPAFFLFFQDSQAMLGMMNGSTIFIMSLLILLVVVILAMIAWFAPTLLLFHDITAGQAIKLSIKGCVKNILPFLWYSIILGLLVIGAMIPFGLGMLVVMPLTFITMYTAYRQIFITP